MLFLHKPRFFLNDIQSFMNCIAERFNTFKNQLTPGVSLVAVSKTRTLEEIMQAYESGHRDFGENKVQDLLSRHENLPGDIRWHMIGHLQTNKVKYIISFIHLIHSVDSEKLLKVINKEAAKAGKITDCLLQIRIAREETKFGLQPQQARELAGSGLFEKYPHVRICGLMGMASFTEDTGQIAEEFSILEQEYRHYQGHYFKGRPEFEILSMGMSDDYLLALSHGSNMLRVGSALFGERS